LETIVNTIYVAIAVAMLIGVLIGYLHAREYDESFAVWMSFLCIVGGFVGAFIGVIIAAIAMPGFVPNREVVHPTIALASMQGTEGTRGTFVLGTGASESRMNYFFLIQNGDGSFTPAQIAADSHVRIIEDANLRSVGYWTSTFSVPDLSSPQASWAIGLGAFERLVKEELRVPVGSVHHGFSANPRAD
jgi:hypothetical protein